MTGRGHYIDGEWTADGGTVEPTLRAIDPTTGEASWVGHPADAGAIDRAIAAARRASEMWGDWPFADRVTLLQSFGGRLKARRAELIDAICRSTGKPRWEAGTEVDAVFGKIALSIEAIRERRVDVEKSLPGNVRGATRHKPHGVVAVFGPFNFPAHLPNGHIVPALLAGNAVLFKPSEQTPLVGEVYADLWHEAGIPRGVFNLLQGGRGTGALLAGHPQIDGLFFTGSYPAGLALARASLEQTGKILALEMGGNGPLVVHDVADVTAAAYWTIQSAFLTAGQRCSCARRLILCGGKGDDAFLERLVAMTKSTRVGSYAETPEPFMGPVISDKAAERLLAAQSEFLARGARSLVEMQPIAGQRRAMLSPGIIDVTEIDRDDVELFGPILQLIRVADFDAALAEANHTRYGLAAALFSDRRELWERFSRRIRAGVVNWNRPTTGASGALPFGGVGLSGNGRPSGYFAADYCSWPVATMESDRLEMPASPSPGIVA